MRLINPDKQAGFIRGGSTDVVGDVNIKTTVGDLFGLVRPAGPLKPIPPHIDVNMLVVLAPKTWLKPKLPFVRHN